MIIKGICPFDFDKRSNEEFIRDPKSFLNKQDQEFGFSLEKHDGSIIAARGIWGKIPCYYCVIDGKFHFANHIDNLKKLYNKLPAINEQWLLRRLQQLTQPPEDTVFEDIKRIPPGYLVHFKDGKISVDKWQILTRPVLQKELTFEEAQSKLWDAMFFAVKRRLPATGNVAFELSGGIDSSIICGIAIKIIGKDRVRTFSHIRNSEPYKSAEIPDDRELIQNFVDLHGIHNELIDDCGLSLQNDMQTSTKILGFPPTINTVSFNHRIYESAQRHGCRTIFSGFGGDEAVTQQYRVPIINELIEQKEYYALFQLTKYENPRSWFIKFPKYLIQYLNKKNNFITDYTYSDPCLFLREEFILPPLKTFLNKSNTYTATVDSTVNSPFNAYRLEESYLTGAHYNLKYEFPFFDYNLIKLYLSLPVKYKMINGQKRSLVKKTFEDILPDSISKGNKSTNPTIPNAEERFYLSIDEEQLLKDTPLKKYMNSSYKHYGKVILPHQLSYFLKLNSKAFK